MGVRSVRHLLAAGLLVVLAKPRVVDAQGCQIPGFGDAAFGKNGVTFTGNGCTDSFNSATGTYGTTNCTVNPPCVGSVGTDSTNGGAITLTGNACVKGTCDIGNGGSTSSISGSSGCTSTGVEPSQILTSQVTVPLLPNGTPFNVTSPAAPAPGYTYGTVTGSGDSTNTITLGAVGTPSTYVMGNVSFSGQSTLVVPAGAGPVTVYLDGTSLQLTGGGVVNNTGKPTGLIFLCGPSVTNVAITGNGTADFAVYCPNANIQITGNGDIYGAVVGASVTDTGNGTIHYDAALGSVTSGAISCTPIEVSRATPIIATVPYTGGIANGALVQGTYEAPYPAKTKIATNTDVASFTFPYIKGHMRARLVSSVSTTATTFSQGTVLFDAGADIPAVNYGGCSTYTGSCRNVFTVLQVPNLTTGVSFKPPLVQFNDSNASVLGPPITQGTSVTSAYYDAIVRLVLQGQSGGTKAQLGGVDRSTVAVIPPSQFAGGARPQVAYFGATDGMIHAVCADSGPCTLGTELWAFMPREQLPNIAANNTRIDGSVRVVDAFGDFYGTGTKSFRTILTFQMATGTSSSTTGATPAVYALDITDPLNPAVLWEYTVPNPAARRPYELGNGLSVAQGVTNSTGQTTNVVYVETNNGGTAGSGVVVTAINAETGTPLSAFGNNLVCTPACTGMFGYAYPFGRVGGDGAPPATGMPGGAVIVDKTGLGLVTDLVFADLYGNVWELDPGLGTSRFATGPLFSFTTDFHPIGAVPAIYANGNQQFAVITSGGYADYSDTTWGSNQTQYALGVNLSPPTTVVPPPLTEASGPPNVPFSLAFGTNGERSYAQALVIGTQLFVTTDNADVNNNAYGGSGLATGAVYGFNLAGGGGWGSTVVVAGGASSVAAASGQLYTSSNTGQQQVSGSGITTSAATLDTMNVPKMLRRLWLRTQ